METRTFKLKDIQANPALIDGLKFKYRDSEAKTETYCVPEAPAIVVVEVPKPPKPPKPPKEAKSTKKK
jgi:hypothetical protein